jgi:hypothetical protein
MLSGILTYFPSKQQLSILNYNTEIKEKSVVEILERREW